MRHVDNVAVSLINMNYVCQQEPPVLRVPKFEPSTWHVQAIPLKECSARSEALGALPVHAVDDPLAHGAPGAGDPSWATLQFARTRLHRSDAHW